MSRQNDHSASSNRNTSAGSYPETSESTGNLSLNAKRGSPNGDRSDDNSSAHAPPASDTNSLPDAVKNPDEWVTGDESMTGAQASYLKTLTHEAGEEMDETLTKAEASKRIDELQSQTGRGRDH